MTELSMHPVADGPPPFDSAGPKPSRFSFGGSSIIAMTLLAVLAFPARASNQPPAAIKKNQQSIEIVRLTDAFIKAQHDFDQDQLRALTADDYVEISPIGEVDPREKMIGFYDPAKKAEGPSMTIGERTIRMIGGDNAIAVTSIAFAVPSKDGPRMVALRTVFVAHRERGRWKLVSAQYTPIRTK